MTDLDQETMTREGFTPLELVLWRQTPNGWDYDNARRWTFETAAKVQQLISQAIYQHSAELNKGEMNDANH